MMDQSSTTQLPASNRAPVVMDQNQLNLMVDLMGKMKAGANI